MQKSRAYFYIGFVLLFCFIMQEAFNLRWLWLQDLQQNQSYKRWSGLFLLLYLCGQWYFPLQKIQNKRNETKKTQERHYEWGCFAPAVFYIHSMKLGFGYLFLLSFVYLGNVLVGLFNRKIVNILLAAFADNRIPIGNYSYYWVISHIVLSVLTIVLVLYHIGIVFYYQ